MHIPLFIGHSTKTVIVIELAEISLCIEKQDFYGDSNLRVFLMQLDLLEH